MAPETVHASSRAPGAQCKTLIDEAAAVAQAARDVSARVGGQTPAFWRGDRVLAHLRACEQEVTGLAERVAQLHDRWLAVSSAPVEASGCGIFGLQYALDAIERERQHRLPMAILAADAATQRAHSAVTNAFASQTQHAATWCAWLSVGLGALSVVLGLLALAR